MSYFWAILIVFLSALIAGALSFVIDRFVSVEARRKHHEVGFQVFAIIGLMFSVLLAFVFSETWSEYNAAKQSISNECGALHGAAMIAAAMPNGEGHPLIEDMRFYASDVVNREWPIMADQRRSIETAHNLRTAVFDAVKMPTSTGSDLANRSQILELLSQAHAARETRTFQLDLGLPDAMWTVLIVLSIMLIALSALAGDERFITVAFAAIFAASIVMVLVLVRMLDYPFQGALALDPEDFVKLGGQLNDLLALK
jgi:Protein of unknown function (DUF4239)